MEDAKTKVARERIDAARKHLTDAIEAISGPEPNWPKCEAHINMAEDVLPYVKDGELQ